MGQKIKPEVVTEVSKKKNHNRSQIKIEGKASVRRLMMKLTNLCNKLIAFFHTA